MNYINKQGFFQSGYLKLSYLVIQIFFLFCLSACQFFSAQREQVKEPSNKEDKEDKAYMEKKVRIGLFISGAGANTFSAVSLLELFHQEKIRFDFISGTGWGAWLAALYGKHQSVDELKWNLFKLKEQKVFETKWFNNQRKQAKLLRTLTTEALSGGLQNPFVCPALNKKGQMIWLTENRPVSAALGCLNKLPPLFLSFNKISEQGSLFSADISLEYMHNRGMDILIWIKPAFFPKARTEGKTVSFYWKELYSYLNHIQKQSPRKYPKLIILETPFSSFDLDDFSRLNVIMKSPPSLSAREKIYRLNRQKGGISAPALKK